MDSLTHMQIYRTCQPKFIQNDFRSDTYLKHVVRLLPHAISESKTVENLEAPTLEAVRLTAKDLGVSLVYDTSFYAAVCHPCCRHEPIRISTVRHVQVAIASAIMFVDLPSRASSDDQPNKELVSKVNNQHAMEDVSYTSTSDSDNCVDAIVLMLGDLERSRAGEGFVSSGP